MVDTLRGILLGLIVVAVLTPAAVWAIGLAKRQRGGAVLLSGVLLVFGLGTPIPPPPPTVSELIRRSAEGEGDGDDV